MGITWQDVAVRIATVLPDRFYSLEYLRRQCEQQHIPYDVIVDQQRNARTTLACVLRSVAAMSSSKRWLLHLEDDAVLAPDAAARILACLQQPHVDCWAFYSNRQRDMEPAAQAHGWYIAPMRTLSTLVAVAWPAAHCSSLLDFAPTWYSMHPEHHDARDYMIAVYGRQHQWRLGIAVPSCVQHRALPSLLGHRPRRQSRSFLATYGPIDEG